MAGMRHGLYRAGRPRQVPTAPGRVALREVSAACSRNGGLEPRNAAPHRVGDRLPLPLAGRLVHPVVDAVEAMGRGCALVGFESLATGEAIQIALLRFHPPTSVGGDGVSVVDVLLQGEPAVDLGWPWPKTRRGVVRWQPAGRPVTGIARPVSGRHPLSIFDDNRRRTEGIAAPALCPGDPTSRWRHIAAAEHVLGRRDSACGRGAQQGQQKPTAPLAKKAHESTGTGRSAR